MSEEPRRRTGDPPGGYSASELVELIGEHEPADLDTLVEATGMDRRMLKERLDELAGSGVVLSIDRGAGPVWMTRGD